MTKSLWRTIPWAIALSVAWSAHSAPIQRTIPPAPLPPPPAFLTATISDIARPYTVIDSTCVFQAFLKAASADDPLEEALAAAFARVRKIAADAGANGLIGYNVEFASPVGREPGRLLLCGTLVRVR